MRQQPQTDPFDGTRNAIGLLLLICRAFACSVELFWHQLGSLGERYFFGLQTGIAAVLIVLWPALCRPVYGFNWDFFFLGSYFIACCSHKARIAERVKRGGPQPHSRHTGTPWLTRLLPRVGEARIKSFVEPMLTFLIGAVVAGTLSPPVGGFLMAASLGLLISNNIGNGTEQQRALDMHDAYLDQRSVIDRFRNGRGKR